jgi:hypothetical protein
MIPHQPASRGALINPAMPDSSATNDASYTTRVGHHRLSCSAERSSWDVVLHGGQT